MSTPRGTKPGYIKSHAEIQPGDIIFFPSSGYMVSSIIEGAQKYFIPKKEDGHANSTHVAICTGHDEKGVPLISHMVMPAYEQIPLTGYLKWYAGNDSGLIVFRANDSKVADKISQKAGDKKLNEGTKYSVKSAAVDSLTTPSTLGYQRKKSDESKEKLLPKVSHCSRWVVDMLKVATDLDSQAEQKMEVHSKAETELEDGYIEVTKEGEDDEVKDGHPHRPNVRAKITPMTLEHFLYKNPNYNYLIYPKQNPYQKTQELVLSILEKLGNPPKLKEAYDFALGQNQWDKDINDLDKTIFLLQAIMPIFRKSHYDEYLTLKNFAKQMGVYKREIFAESYAPTKDFIWTQIQQLAKKARDTKNPLMIALRDKAADTYEETRGTLDGLNEMEDSEKTAQLLRVMLPIFSKKYGFFTPNAYHDLIDFAKSRAIPIKTIQPVNEVGILREAFDKTFDLVLPNGKRRADVLGWPAPLPRTASTSDKANRFFAMVWVGLKCAVGWPEPSHPLASDSDKVKRSLACLFSVLGAPFNLLVIKPLKLFLEFPTKALEVLGARSKSNIGDLVENFFGMLSSGIRYIVSMDPYQAVKECSSPDALPSRLLGHTVGKWLGGLWGGILSMAGIIGFAFGLPFAIVSAVGAIAGPTVASSVSSALATADTGLRLGNAGSAVFGVVNISSTAAMTSGVGLTSLTTGISVASSTSNMMKEFKSTKPSQSANYGMVSEDETDAHDNSLDRLRTTSVILDMGTTEYLDDGPPGLEPIKEPDSPSARPFQ